MGTELPTTTIQPPRLTSASSPVRFDRDAASASSAPACLNRTEEPALRISQTDAAARRAQGLLAFVRIAGVTTVVVGCLVIVGWIADIRFLRSISTEWTSMVFNAAVSFVLLGTALVLSVSGAVDIVSCFWYERFHECAPTNNQV